MMARPEAIELVRDRRAGRITESQLLAAADSLELDSDDLEDAEEHVDEHPEES
jgi:hypothetical protein